MFHKFYIGIMHNEYSPCTALSWRIGFRQKITELNNLFHLKWRNIYSLNQKVKNHWYREVKYSD